MGLRKRLGSPTIKTIGDSIADVDFQWSTQSYTLREIISKFKLPCVVQCSADQCSVTWSKFQFNLKQPLLLYNIRTVNKIFARTVRHNTEDDDDKNEYIEFGPPLVIPEDYEGWFASVKDDAVTRHIRVEEVAEAENESFLAASKVPVFYLNGGESTGVYSPHYVNPGQVLRKDGFINGPLDAPGQSNFAAKDKHHLKCIDDKEEEFVIPFSHRGIFYDVSEEASVSSKGVFNTRQIMDTGGSKFPLTLKHIQGDLPALNYSFTGFIQCNHIFSEQTIVACSIGANAPIPLELECKSKIRFSIALNEVDLKFTNEYQRSIDFCHIKAEHYARAIKVSFTIKPDMSTLEELDYSLYDNESDMEDVDAQSEFDIDWGPENQDSKKDLESLISLKKAVSPINSLETPAVNDSVDVGESFELENNSDQVLYKKALEYTESAESQESTMDDVTVDSSLFEDHSRDSLNNTMENDLQTNGHPSIENGISEKDNLKSLNSTESSNKLEFVGNLSKTVPGRLLKEEATRTSSGVDENASKNKLNEDWGPEIPVVAKIDNKDNNLILITNGEIPQDDSQSENESRGDTQDSEPEDDQNERCVVDSDKDTSGRLMSYRSIGSLNKIGPNGEVHDDLGIASMDLNNNSGNESDLNPLDHSFTDDQSYHNSSLDDINSVSTLSESAFVLPNGGAHDCDNESDTSDFLENVREELDIHWEKSDDSNDTVVHNDKPKSPKTRVARLSQTVMDMSLEEAVV